MQIYAPFLTATLKCSGAQSFASSVAFIHESSNVLVLTYDSGQPMLLNLLTLLLSAAAPPHSLLVHLSLSLTHLSLGPFPFFFFFGKFSNMIKSLFNYLTFRCSETRGFFKNILSSVLLDTHFLIIIIRTLKCYIL